MGTKRSAPLDHCSTEGRKPSTSRDKLPFYVVDLGHLVKKKKRPSVLLYRWAKSMEEIPMNKKKLSVI
jgi:hypothetical protein